MFYSSPDSVDLPGIILTIANKTTKKVHRNF